MNENIYYFLVREFLFYIFKQPDVVQTEPRLLRDLPDGPSDVVLPSLHRPWASMSDLSPRTKLTSRWTPLEGSKAALKEEPLCCAVLVYCVTVLRDGQRGCPLCQPLCLYIIMPAVLTLPGTSGHFSPSLLPLLMLRINVWITVSSCLEFAVFS